MSLEAEAASVLGPGEVQVEPLAHGRGLTATVDVARVRWGGASAVRKVVSPAVGDPRPSHFRYWRREVLAYEEGVPAPYREAGLRPPRVLATRALEDGAVALWLEDVRGAPGTSWGPERYAVAARAMGRAQGALHVAPPPARPWWSRGFLSDYLEYWAATPWHLLDDDEAWAAPPIAAHFPGGLRPAMTRLHRERAAFLGWLRAAPRTLAHLDFWVSNLIDADGETVLLDWAFLGDGALGEDVGNLVPEASLDLWLPATLLPEIDRLVFDAYVGGLREAGWDGDPGAVRLAMCAAAVKYVWLAPYMLRAAADTTGGTRAYGRDVPPERFFAERGAVLAFLAGWADEARRIAGRS